MLPIDDSKKHSLDPEINPRSGLRFNRVGLFLNVFLTLLILVPPIYFAGVALFF